MGIGADPGMARQFRAMFGAGTASGLTDGQLLDRFLTGGAEDAEVAFGALLARHGPMVLGVCRRALRDPAEAEDAFQATFLILVRKGRSVRVEDSLGRWLYGVSRRVAGRARARADRRRRVEGAAIGDLAARPDPDGRELASALDEELGRLAEPFRSAVVLCDLGGLSHEEAARDLRCPVGTVKSRLARGRERLRGRLARRGFAPSAMALSAGAPAPLSLIDATIGVATRYAASGGTLPAGSVPASVVVLAEGALRSMTMTKIQATAAAALMMIGLAGTGAAVLAQRPGDGPPAATRTPGGVVEVAVPAPDLSSQEARLDRPVTVELSGKGLRAIQDALQDQSGLRIIIDPKGMEARRVGWWNPQMDLAAKAEPLRSVLTRWLDPLGLAWQGVWGGPEGIIYVTAAERSPKLTLGAGIPTAGSPSADPKLDRPVTVRLRDRPIEEVNRALMEQSGMSIVLDPRALHNLGMSRDTPAGLAVEAVPLRVALTTWLRGTGLGWRSEDGGVLVTTIPPGSEPGRPASGDPADFRSARREVERLVEGLETSPRRRP